MTLADFRSLCTALGFSVFAVTRAKGSCHAPSAAVCLSDFVRALYPSSPRHLVSSNQNYDHLRTARVPDGTLGPDHPPELAESLPWSSHHGETVSHIEAFDPASGDWQKMLEVKSTSTFSAEQLATFITRAVNDAEQQQKLVRQLTLALETCLKAKGALDWSAEHDAKIALSRARQKSNSLL